VFPNWFGTNKLISMELKQNKDCSRKWELSKGMARTQELSRNCSQGQDNDKDIASGVSRAMSRLSNANYKIKYANGSSLEGSFLRDGNLQIQLTESPIEYNCYGVRENIWSCPGSPSPGFSGGVHPVLCCIFMRPFESEVQVLSILGMDKALLQISAAWRGNSF